MEIRPELALYDGPAAAAYGMVWEAWLEHAVLLIPLSRSFAPVGAAVQLLVEMTRNRREGHRPSVGVPGRDANAARNEILAYLQRRTTHAVVLAPQTGASSDAAICFALGSGRGLQTYDGLVDGLKQAAKRGVESVTIFDEVERFDVRALAAAWRLSRDRGMRMGLVPSRGRRHELEWWLGRRLLADAAYHRHEGLLILARDATASSFEDASSVVPESAFASDHVGLVARPHQLCFVEFHAKECCAKFNQHVFCARAQVDAARAAAASGEQSRRAVPRCARDGTCVWPLQRIHVSDINAAHFVAVSCGSLRLFDGMFHTDVGLGLNTFAGVPRSYLSPMRFVVSNAILSSYLADLAMAGERLGDLALAANEFLRDTLADDDCFVLLGDPDDTVDVERALDGMQSVAATPSHVILAASPMSEAPMVRTARPAALPCVAALGDPSLQDPSWRARTPPPLFSETGAELPVTPIDVLTQFVYRDNREGLWPSLLYGSAEHRRTGRMEQCLWCRRECAVYDRRAPGMWERVVVNCPACGIICDVPEGGYGVVQFDAPREVSHGERMRLTSSFPVEDQTNVCGALSLIHCMSFGWASFEATTATLRAEGPTARLEMEVAVPVTAYPFGYWVRVTWIDARGVWWLSRPLVVLDGSELPRAVL